MPPEELDGLVLSIDGLVMLTTGVLLVFFTSPLTMTSPDVSFVPLWKKNLYKNVTATYMEFSFEYAFKKDEIEIIEAAPKPNFDFFVK